MLAVAVPVIFFVAGREDGGTAAEPVIAAVCRVADLVAEDPAAAGRAFTDRAHEPLHALAREAADGGARAAAARLLEAKNMVEEAEDGPTPAAVDELVSATRAALAAVGRPEPGPCT